MKPHAIFLSTLVLASSLIGCGGSPALEEDANAVDGALETQPALWSLPVLPDLEFGGSVQSSFRKGQLGAQRYFRAWKGQVVSIVVTTTPLEWGRATPRLCIVDLVTRKCAASGRLSPDDPSKARLEYTVPADGRYLLAYWEGNPNPWYQDGTHAVELGVAPDPISFSAAPVPAPTPLDTWATLEAPRLSRHEATGNVYAAFAGTSDDAPRKTGVRFGRYDAARNTWSFSTILEDSSLRTTRLVVDKRGDIHVLALVDVDKPPVYLRSMDGGQTFEKLVLEAKWGRTVTCDLAEGGGFSNIVGVCGSLLNTYMFARQTRASAPFNYRALETMPVELGGAGTLWLATSISGNVRFMSTSGCYGAETPSGWVSRLNLPTNVSISPINVMFAPGRGGLGEALVYRDSLRWDERGWMTMTWGADGRLSYDRPWVDKSPWSNNRWVGSAEPSSQWATGVQSPSGAIEYIFDGYHRGLFGRSSIEKVNLGNWPRLDAPSGLRLRGKILIAGAVAEGSQTTARKAVFGVIQ